MYFSQEKDTLDLIAKFIAKRSLTGSENLRWNRSLPDYKFRRPNLIWVRYWASCMYRNALACGVEVPESCREFLEEDGKPKLEPWVNDYDMTEEEILDYFNTTDLKEYEDNYDIEKASKNWSDMNFWYKWMNIHRIYQMMLIKAFPLLDEYKPIKKLEEFVEGQYYIFKIPTDDDRRLEIQFDDYYFVGTNESPFTVNLEELDECYYILYYYEENGEEFFFNGDKVSEFLTEHDFEYDKNANRFTDKNPEYNIEEAFDSLLGSFRESGLYRMINIPLKGKISRVDFGAMFKFFESSPGINSIFAGESRRRNYPDGAFVHNNTDYYRAITNDDLTKLASLPTFYGGTVYPRLGETPISSSVLNKGSYSFFPRRPTVNDVFDIKEEDSLGDFEDTVLFISGSVGGFFQSPIQSPGYFSSLSSQNFNYNYDNSYLSNATNMNTRRGFISYSFGGHYIYGTNVSLNPIQSSMSDYWSVGFKTANDGSTYWDDRIINAPDGIDTNVDLGKVDSSSFGWWFYAPQGKVKWYSFIDTIVDKFLLTKPVGSAYDPLDYKVILSIRRFESRAHIYSYDWYSNDSVIGAATVEIDLSKTKEELFEEIYNYTNFDGGDYVMVYYSSPEAFDANSEYLDDAQDSLEQYVSEYSTLCSQNEANPHVGSVFFVGTFPDDETGGSAVFGHYRGGLQSFQQSKIQTTTANLTDREGLTHNYPSEYMFDPPGGTDSSPPWPRRKIGGMVSTNRTDGWTTFGRYFNALNNTTGGLTIDGPFIYFDGPESTRPTRNALVRYPLDSNSTFFDLVDYTLTSWRGDGESVETETNPIVLDITTSDGVTIPRPSTQSTLFFGNATSQGESLYRYVDNVNFGQGGTNIYVLYNGVNADSLGYTVSIGNNITLTKTQVYGDVTVSNVVATIDGGGSPASPDGGERTALSTIVTPGMTLEGSPTYEPENHSWYFARYISSGVYSVVLNDNF